MNADHYDYKKLDSDIEKTGVGNFKIAEEIGKDYMTVNRARKGRGVSFEVIADIVALFGWSIHDYVYAKPKKTRLKSKTKNFSSMI